MRIAFVTETWLPFTNGVVTRLVATANELGRLGHQILVVAPSNGSPKAGTASNNTPNAAITTVTVPQIRIPFVYGGQPWGLPVPRVAHALEDFAPDVVHVINPVLLGIAGVRAATNRNLPLVTSYHTDVATYASYYRLGWTRPALQRLTYELHRRGHINLVTSTTGRRALHRLGLPNAMLWPRGVDLQLFHPRCADARLRRQLTGRNPSTLALYVGRLALEKGVDRLGPLSRHPGVHLLIVGDGPDRARLERNLGGPSVTFTGNLHGQALANAYAAADVFVFPSMTETLGLVLLEALASGLPVVAADTAASREALGSCCAVRLFPPRRPDAIPGLVAELTPPDGRPLLRKEARAAVEDLGWTDATAGLVAMYERAVIAAQRPQPVGASPR